MKGIPGMRLLLNGETLVEYDIETALSNVLTAILSTNNRPSTIPGFSPLLLLAWFRKVVSPEGNGPLASFRISAQANSGSDLGLGLTDEQKQLLAALTKTPILVENVGDYMIKLLTSLGLDATVTIKDAITEPEATNAANPYLSTSYVNFPCTGYPRPWYGLGRLWSLNDATQKKAGMGDKSETLASLSANEILQSSLFKVAGIGCTWSRNIAEMLLLLSFPQWSVELIPGIAANTTLAGHSVKDKSIGQLIARQDQLEALAAAFYVFAFQGPLLQLHRNRRLHDRIIPVAKELYPTMADYIDKWDQARQYCLSRPIHTLLTALASSAQVGHVATRNGDRESLYIPPLEMVDPKKLDISLIESFVAEVHSSVVSRPPASWKRLHSLECEMLSVTTLAQILKTSNMEQDMQRAASHFKWTTVSASLDPIHFTCADFMLCDGRQFSKNAWNGLLGWTPVLSFANIKVLGIARREETDFSVVKQTKDVPGNVINWSIVPMMGHLTGPSNGLAYERSYIPEGMSMGEPDTLLVNGLAKRDVVARDMVQHYTTHTRNYVKSQYVTPRFIKDSSNTRYSSWDTFTVANNPKDVLDQFQAVYQPQLLPIPALEQSELMPNQMAFLHSPHGFAQRIPVRSCRPDRILQYTPEFTFRELQFQDGFVVYDGDVQMTSTASMAAALQDVIHTNALPFTEGEPEVSAPVV